MAMSQADNQAAQLLLEANLAAESDEVDVAIKSAIDSLEIYRELGQAIGVGSALTLLLTCHISQGEMTLSDALKAIKEEASRQGSVSGRIGEAAMLLATAEVYLAVGDFDNALKAALDSQSLFSKEGAILKEAETLSRVIVIAYLQNSNPEKALMAANQALSLVQKETDRRAQACAWFAAALARYASEAVEDALDAAMKTLSLAKDFGGKFKESEALCFMSQVYLGKGDTQSALSAAHKALVSAKDMKSGRQMALAVGIIVEVHIQKESPQDALRLAEEELEALQKSRKTAGLSSMMGAVIIATTAAKGPNAGFDVVKTCVESCRSSGNVQGEVEMLHRMACMAEYPDVAMNTAQAALKLAQKGGFAYQEVKIKDTLTDLWVARGRVDKAPTRKYALTLLNELSRNLEKTDADKFQETNKKLNKYWSALTQTDMEATIHKVIAKDPDSYMAFLKKHGTMAEEPARRDAPIPGHKFKSLPHKTLYLGFRVSGLAYGPRFRVLSSANKAVHEVGRVVAVVELSECSDDWERELCYNPSLLDGALQSGVAQGY